MTTFSWINSLLRVSYSDPYIRRGSFSHLSYDSRSRDHSVSEGTWGFSKERVTGKGMGVDGRLQEKDDRHVDCGDEGGRDHFRPE